MNFRLQEALDCLKHCPDYRVIEQRLTKASVLWATLKEHWVESLQDMEGRLIAHIKDRELINV